MSRLPIGELSIVTTEMDQAQQQITTEQFSKKVAKRFMDAQEISLPVGMSEDGEVVFAHLRFDGGIKKSLLANLRALLEAMEKPLSG